MALSALSSKTPFDLRSLDLPSIAALVGFYHACMGFPVKQTWLEAIKAGNFDTFEGLTYSNAAKYCPDADKTIMGHQAQQRQNVRSTKPMQPTILQVPLPTPAAVASNHITIVTQPLSKLFTDDTGRLPVKARSGNQYVMIAFHTDGNLILQQAFKTKSDRHHIATYNSIMTRLAARGLSVDLQILDNKASSAHKEAITFKWNARFQLVPPDMHRRNRAERAICTFKDHFLAILAGVDAAFPPYRAHPQSASSIQAESSDQCMGVVSGALRLQHNTIRPSWLSGPHPCQTGNLTILGLPCQEWLLHWSGHGFLPLLQACQCGYQEPSHLRYSGVLTFLSFHPGSIYRRQNHSWPTGCHRCTQWCDTTHKHFPS